MLSTTRNTFLAYLALAFIVSTVHASGDFHHVQRDHVNLKRIIKKRSPAPQNQGLPGPAVANAGQDPDQVSPVSSSAAISPTDSAVAPSASSPAVTPSSSSRPPFLGGVLTGLPLPSITDLVSGLLPTSSPSSIASLSTSSTISLTSSVPTSTVQTTETPSTTAVPISLASTTRPIVTVTAEDPSAQTTEPIKPTGAAQVRSTTLMILIIIASSLGGIAILWTVFRKWKLGRSSKFDERLQPIDWQPTDDRDDGIIPGLRRAPSNASSFHSGGHANAMGNYGATSDHGHGNLGGTSTLQPIPDHDFTAGAAPIGGYADLARGPSPPMTEAPNRGPSFNRGYDYDGGVPLHHQAGGAYGAYDYQGSRY